VAGAVIAAPPTSDKKPEPAKAATATAASNAKPAPQEPLAAGDKRSDALEIVYRFTGPMPVGVAVNSTGRIFVSYPRWTDKGKWTLAEIKDGQEIPYPRGGVYQEGNQHDPVHNLVSLQGLVVDAKDRLWILDTGTVEMKPVQPFSPKLIAIDTRTDRVVKTILLPKPVAPESTYLNDLRIDLRRGDGEGIAFITDSGATSPDGIICVDLKSGRAWRRLAGQPSVQAAAGFIGKAEGQPLYLRPKPGVKKEWRVGIDGIALSPDGKYLYYTPTSSRELYRIKVDPLIDEGVSDHAVDKQVEDLGEKGTSDGLLEDTAGRIYITDWEKRAITRRNTEGKIETLVQDDRLLWPDTMALSRDGYLYLITNQLYRQPNYNEGVDKRQPPYLLVRIKTEDAKPVLLDDTPPAQTANGQQK